MVMVKEKERGVTLIELLVTVAILSVITLLFYTLVTGAMNANVQLEAHSVLSSYGQRAINMMKSEIAQAKRIFVNDTFGNGVVSQLAIPSSYPQASDCRLPTTEAGKDAFSSVPTGSIGNSFLFLQDFPPFEDNNNYYIDLYRFAYYYLTEKNAGGLQIANLPNYLDLVRFRSVYYASYEQIMSIPNESPDKDREAALSALAAAGINYAIDNTAVSINDFFYKNTGNSLTKETGHNIPSSEVLPLIRQLSGAKVSARIRYAIAYNSGASFPILTPVPKYATETDRPFGFETLIVGPTSAREVLLRMVFVVDVKKRLFSQPMEVMIQAKEY
jgi:prepilin-type N-terminal cleavage/methylation domain-containing protein